MGACIGSKANASNPPSVPCSPCTHLRQQFLNPCAQPLPQLLSPCTPLYLRPPNTYARLAQQPSNPWAPLCLQPPYPHAPSSLQLPSSASASRPHWALAASLPGSARWRPSSTTARHDGTHEHAGLHARFACGRCLIYCRTVQVRKLQLHGASLFG